jgi:molybdopterin converting factor small subunit
MPILVKLYGKLRENVKDADLEKGLPVTLNIEECNVHFVYDIVEKFAISEDELSHIFVNGKYCGIGKDIKEGDRIGLFPKNMALMFAEIRDKSRC